MYFYFWEMRELRIFGLGNETFGVAKKIKILLHSKSQVFDFALPFNGILIDLEYLNI